MGLVGVEGQVYYSLKIARTRIWLIHSHIGLGGLYLNKRHRRQKFELISISLSHLGILIPEPGDEAGCLSLVLGPLRILTGFALK